MRTFLLILLTVVISGKLFFQNAGIGTPDPLAKLHVESGFPGEAIRVSAEFTPYRWCIFKQDMAAMPAGITFQLTRKNADANTYIR